MYYFANGQISGLLRLFWSDYSDTIIKGIEQHRSLEKTAGYSCKMYVVQQFQLAFELALLVLYYSNVIGLTYAEIYERLDIETKEKNLACNNIIWSDILTAMNINTTTGDGIENVDIEGTFIVGPNPTPTPLTQIDVTSWRTVKHNCVNLL